MKIQLNKLFRLLFIWILPLIIIAFGITINHAKTYDQDGNELTCNQSFILENNWLSIENIDTRELITQSNFTYYNLNYGYYLDNTNNYYISKVYNTNEDYDYYLYLFYQVGYGNNENVGWIYCFTDEIYDNLTDIRDNLYEDGSLITTTYKELLEQYNDGDNYDMQTLEYNTLVYQGEYYTQPKNPIQKLNNIIFEQLGINTNSQITIFINYYITIVCINIIIYTIVIGLLGIILIIPKKMGKKDDDY